MADRDIEPLPTQVNEIGCGFYAHLNIRMAARKTSKPRNQPRRSKGRDRAYGLVVPVVAVLMQTASWRYGFGALTAVALTLALVAFLLLPRSNGALNAESVTPPTGSMMAGIGALLRVPAFHILFWSFMICGFTTAGVIETHLLPYASFCCFPPLPSATAYGVLSAVNLGGMVLAGFLDDRLHRPTLLGGIYLVRAVSFALLLHVAPDIRLLYIFVVLFGLVDYSTVPVTVGLAVSHLGLERIGLAMGLISGGHALGGALGAFAGGLLFDVTGAYGWLWIGSLALSTMAGLMVFTLPDKPTERSNTTLAGAAPLEQSSSGLESKSMAFGGDRA